MTTINIKTEIIDLIEEEISRRVDAVVPYSSHINYEDYQIRQREFKDEERQRIVDTLFLIADNIHDFKQMLKLHKER